MTSLPINSKQAGFAANALTAPTSPDNRMAVVDKSKVDPQLRAACEGMEGMFLDYMMKVMRQTVPKDEMSGDSPATAIYQGMQDSEMAQKAVKAGGVGLADQLIAYLDSQRYTLPREHGVPVVSNGTGGTAHEGQPVHK